MNQPNPSDRRRRRVIAGWLIAVCAMVFVMVVLGGVTRLTHSGLSMVEWRPVTGWLPPLDEATWEDTFAKYREYPEYMELNVGMTLDEFKSIFWLEFLHRLWGRVIGVAFLVPFVFFVVRGWVDRRLMTHLGVIFVLGGLQGVLGWYMVKSGLVDRPDVSQYRLTAHLGAALVVLGYMLWVALGLLFPEPHPAAGRRPGTSMGLALTIVGLTTITVLSGGFVAGLDAGFAYNTFPLMDGELVPDNLFALSPLLLNFFEDITTVQFFHRLLAETILVLVAVFWFRTHKAGAPPRARLAVDLLALVAVCQVGLGILTLVLMVPVSIAAAHQGAAVVLFSVALWTVHELRPEKPETGEVPVEALAKTK